MSGLSARILDQNTLGSRNHGLDLMRAIAILMVLVHHAWIFLSLFFPKAGMLFFLGYWGVELFFALSGFLIGRILINSFLSAEKNSFSIVWNFWKKRWIRTIPIYYIALVLNFILIRTIVGIPVPFSLKYVFFIQNFAEIHPKFFSEAWSLSIEEWFYLIIPVLFFLSFYIPASNKIKRIFTVLVCSLIVFTCIRWIRIPDSFDIIEWDRLIRKQVIMRLDAILYGVLIALFSVVRPIDFIKLKKLFLAAGLLLVTGSYFIFFKKYSPLFNNLFFVSFTSLGFACTLPFFYNLRFANTGFLYCFSFISIISYSMYLTHYTLFRIINTYVKADTQGKATVVFISYLFAAVFIAAIIHLVFEKPFLRLKNKIR